VAKLGYQAPVACWTIRLLGGLRTWLVLLGCHSLDHLAQDLLKRCQRIRINDRVTQTADSSQIKRLQRLIKVILGNLKTIGQEAPQHCQSSIKTFCSTFCSTFCVSG
jgi:hypothetical protein